jgi:putative nucleotidyltransferase with HDIG domain
MFNKKINIHDLVTIIVTILDARDPYTYEHSFRVAEYSECISKSMGLDKATHQRVHYAAHLHDIGKTGISDAVLNKPGLLTIKEMKEMQTHSRIGYNILTSIPIFSSISKIVLYHHERMDGLGYPEGLKGNQIPLESRVIAIADAFDAMTSNRSYRKAMLAEKALEEINKHKGEQFDPELVDSFNNVYPQLNIQTPDHSIRQKLRYTNVAHEKLMHSKKR